MILPLLLVSLFLSIGSPLLSLRLLDLQERVVALSVVYVFGESMSLMPVDRRSHIRKCETVAFTRRPGTGYSGDYLLVEGVRPVIRRGLGDRVRCDLVSFDFCCSF